MKKFFIKTGIPVILTIIMLMSACQLFIGQDPEITPEEVLKSLWKDFDEMHAYIDIRMSKNLFYNSWDDVLNNKDTGYLKKLSSGHPLFTSCAAMLGELNDPHVILFAPGNSSSFTYQENSDYIKERAAFNITSIRTYLKDKGAIKGKNYLYGTFLSEPDIGYIYISSFIDTSSSSLEYQNWVNEINDIVKYMHDNNVKALILDVRNNEGGYGQAAEYIAARFASVEKNYMKASTKNGPGRNDFSDPSIFRIKPEGAGFTKHIALLTNKASISAAEWFTMALQTQHHVTHVGTTTFGAFSPRITRPMINGWFYSISVDRVTDMDGVCHEGIGIIPAIRITNDLEDGEIRSDHPDRQLERVLEEVKKWLDKLP